MLTGSEKTKVAQKTPAQKPPPRAGRARPVCGTTPRRASRAARARHTSLAARSARGTETRLASPPRADNAPAQKRPKIPRNRTCTAQQRAPLQRRSATGRRRPAQRRCGRTAAKQAKPRHRQRTTDLRSVSAISQRTRQLRRAKSCSDQRSEENEHLRLCYGARFITI